MAMLKNLLFLFLIFSMGNAGIIVPNTLDEQCPDGWTNFGVRCFKFFSKSVNWITAERNCISLGANLASAHSGEEQDFLISLLPSSSTRCWVGAHDVVQEGQWLWSDGSAFDYNNWCTGEPNNSNDDEDCLEVKWPSNRCWNDIPCSKKLGYTCATDLRSCSPSAPQLL